MNLLRVEEANAVRVPVFNQQMVEDYIRYLDVSPRTAEAYYRNLRRFFMFTKEHGITEPNRNDVIAYRESLKSEGLKPNTIQAYIISLRSFFKWLNAEGIYPNIADNLKGAKITKEHKKDYITSNQAKSLINSSGTNTLQGIRDTALIALLITGGLRTIELERALVEDLRTKGDNTVLYIQGKGKEDKSDFIKVSPEVESLIRSYHREANIKDPKEPLFQSTSNNSKGKTLSTRSIRGIVKEKLRSIGIDSERITAHSLRHTAITLALINGASIREAQQHARHTDISTTTIYAHDLEKMDNSCSQIVSNLLFSDV